MKNANNLMGQHNLNYKTSLNVYVTALPFIGNVLLRIKLKNKYKTNLSNTHKLDINLENLAVVDCLRIFDCPCSIIVLMFANKNTLH